MGPQSGRLYLIIQSLPIKENFLFTNISRGFIHPYCNLIHWPFTRQTFPKQYFFPSIFFLTLAEQFSCHSLHLSNTAFKAGSWDHPILSSQQPCLAIKKKECVCLCVCQKKRTVCVIQTHSKQNCDIMITDDNVISWFTCELFFYYWEKFNNNSELFIF